MNNEDNIHWWGLKRRPPADWEPAPINRLETIALGCLLGCCLVVLWFCLLETPGFSGGQLTTLKSFAILFYLPVVLFAFIPLGWINSPENPRHQEIAGIFFLLREAGILRKQVDPYIVVAPLAFLGLSLVLSNGNMPCQLIGLSLALTQAGLALFLLRKTPFLTQKKAFTVPEWVADMLKAKAVINEGEAEPLKPSSANAVVPIDDHPDFSYVFSTKLPEGISRVGIAIGEGVMEILQRIASQPNRPFYQGNDFKNVIKMVLLDEAPVDGTGLAEIKRLTAQILTRASEAGWTRAELAIETLRFVQGAINYGCAKATADFEDYGRFPLKTLKDGVGDCQCTSILCCALLSHLGFDCAFLLVDVPSTPLVPGGSHAAVGLKADTLAKALLGGDGLISASNGSLYLYGETAWGEPNPPSWGAIPENWRKELRFQKIVPVPPVQILQELARRS